MEVTKQQAAVFAALKSGNEALKEAQAEVRPVLDASEVIVYC